jgi:putative hydrolase of HD superfamily
MMKRSSVLGALAALTIPIGAPATVLADDKPATSGPEAAGIVEREVAAYNAHDAATVVKMHAPDAVFALLPSGKVLASGSDQLLAFFTKHFSDQPNAKITLERQFLLRNVVVNHYRTADRAGAGIVSIYEVKDGVIANEWLILG